ncbi:hypothetical protein F53441_13526 [Fusarium austroafricanum]|uniref:2EXR domain-containing protein n=1 Tax=Fusarium austroafricanum TaxID=2364996 RepID=A0A8H4JQR6_9HYPO|nr:hypothetical protein F53441_13526 [Fusarium austroafricanum]
MKTFHRFTDLPPEIRALIFLFATPPRLVFVKVKLELSRREPQTTFERVRHFFGQYDNRVDGVKRSYFSSNTTIPALLHTCYESRAMLMSQGYQLTFGSPSTEPRIWFNYDRDVLKPCLAQRHIEGIGNPWRVAQLEPGDMKRVRKLVWHYSSSLISRGLPQHPSLYRIVPWKTLEGFENLEELFLASWVWVCVDIKDYDAQHLLKCINLQPYTILRSFTPVPGLADLDTFDTRRAALEFRNSQVSSEKVDLDWKPPRVTAVHVADKFNAQGLLNMEPISFERFLEIKDSF